MACTEVSCEGFWKWLKCVTMEAGIHGLIHFVFRPCEWNHAKLAIMTFMDVLDTSSCSLCGMRGHVTSDHGNFSL